MISEDHGLAALVTLVTKPLATSDVAVISEVSSVEGGVGVAAK